MKTKTKTEKVKKILSEIGELSIIYQPIKQSLHEEVDENYVETYDGEIMFSLFESNKESVIGKVRFVLVNMERMMSDELNASIDDVLFAGSSRNDYVTNLYQTLFEYETFDFKDEIEKQMGDLMGFNFVIISNLEILPEFRGFELGKEIIKHGYQFFTGKAQLLILKSFPKQLEPIENDELWRAKMDYANMKKENAQKSLDKFYGKYMTKLKAQDGSISDSIFALNLNLKFD